MCNTIYNFSRYFQNILSLNELNNSSIFICIQFHLLEIIFQTISNEIDSDSKRKSKFLKKPSTQTKNTQSTTLPTRVYVHVCVVARWVGRHGYAGGGNTAPRARGRGDQQISAPMAWQK